MRDVLDESGEVSDDTQPVVSAKLEIEALGTQIISMKVVNTKEDVQTYLDTDIQLKTFIHGMEVFNMKIIMRRDSVILSKSRNRFRQRRNLSD